jgi:hypothetical protein
MPRPVSAYIPPHLCLQQHGKPVWWTRHGTFYRFDNNSRCKKFIKGRTHNQKLVLVQQGIAQMIVSNGYANSLHF